MMGKNKLDEAVDWYRINRPIYESLALSVQFIVQEVLEQKKVNYHSVTHRAKEIEKFREKGIKGHYANPQEEIMDMAGVRVITYLDSDAVKASEIIKQLFDIIPGHSIDKAQELGTDRVGYRSIHMVGYLRKARIALAENKKFENLCFEIQIRTILQHAWAEFEHDRNYKFKGVLPDAIKRRFSIVAGSLELVDWTFEAIARDIDNYKIEVKKEIAEGDLSTKITSASLKLYLAKKLEPLIKNGLKPLLTSDEKIINALSLYEINTIEQLDNAIPKDFIEVASKIGYIEPYSSFLIDLMMILNTDLYFEKIWKGSWNYIGKESIKLLENYKVPMAKIMQQYGIGLDNFELPYDQEPPYEDESQDEEPPHEEEEPPDNCEPPDEEPPFDDEPPEESQ